jgi:DNA segregation ATPase FtsK/SpoIIIE-like protein
MKVKEDTRKFAQARRPYTTYNTRQAFYQVIGGIILSQIGQVTGLQVGRHFGCVQGDLGYRCMSLVLNIHPDYLASILGKTRELNFAAGIPAKKDNSDFGIRITIAAEGLLIEVPLPETLWTNLSIDELPTCRGLTIPVGKTTVGNSVVVNFQAPDEAHLATFGSTGSGKSNLIKVLLHNLARQNGTGKVKLILIDCGKGGMDFLAFANMPNLAHPVITEPREAHEALAYGLGEIERRTAYIKQQGTAAGRELPHLFYFIDELPSLVEQDKGVVDLLKAYMAKARAVNLHAVIIAQNPTKELLGTCDFKRNCRHRLVGYTDSPTAAQVATGQGGTGAECLVGAGDFLRVKGPKTDRFTAPYLPDEEVGLRLPRGGPQDQLDFEAIEEEEGEPASCFDPNYWGAGLALADSPDIGANRFAGRLRDAGFPIRDEKALQLRDDVWTAKEAYKEITGRTIEWPTGDVLAAAVYHDLTPEALVKQFPNLIPMAKELLDYAVKEIRPHLIPLIRKALQGG